MGWKSGLAEETIPKPGLKDRAPNKRAYVGQWALKDANLLYFSGEWIPSLLSPLGDAG